MLTVELPQHELFSPCRREKTKSVITCQETKKHLHDIRVQRQNQLTATINECHRLRTIHKEIFNRQFQADNQDKSTNPNTSEQLHAPKPPINPNDSLPTKRYAIPRMDHASELYRQALPAFELHSPTELNHELPIIEQLSQWISEPSCITTNKVIDNAERKSSHQQRQMRPLSVSTVSSTDKRVHKVYEQWPDYNHISQIAGYRIDPPASKIELTNSASSRASAGGGQRKRTPSSRLISATKQIKSIMNLNATPARREPSKTKITSKTEPLTTLAVLAEKPPIIIEPMLSPSMQQPKLPTCLCPSSLLYSQRIRTRQWLLQTNFARYAPRTLPLI